MSKQADIQAFLLTQIQEQIELSKPHFGQDMPEEEKDKLLAICNEEARNTVIKCFELLTDEEIDYWHEMALKGNNPIARRIAERTRHLTVQYGANVGARVVEMLGLE